MDGKTLTYQIKIKYKQDQKLATLGALSQLNIKKEKEEFQWTVPCYISATNPIATRKNVAAIRDPSMAEDKFFHQRQQIFDSLNSIFKYHTSLLHSAAIPCFTFISACIYSRTKFTRDIEATRMVNSHFLFIHDFGCLCDMSKNRFQAQTPSLCFPSNP